MAAPARQPHPHEGSPGRFVLDGGAAWIVDTGRIDVFAAVNAGERAGQRRFLFSAGSGDLLLGIDGGASVHLEAVATLGTKYRRPVAGRSEPAFAGGPALPLEKWLRDVVYGIQPARSAPACVLPGAGELLRVSSPAAVAPDTGLVWLQLHHGEAHVCGLEDFAIAAPAVVPCTADAWVHAQAGCELTTIADPAPEGALPPVEHFTAWYAAAMRALQLGFERASAADRARHQKQLTSAKTELREVCYRIASTASTSADVDAAPAPVAAGDPFSCLIAACARVMAPSGIVLAGVSGEKHASIRDAIADIARTAKCRTREVELPPQWWKRDYGPLLGLLREDRHAVALLPVPGGYVRCDPRDDARVPVDEAEAGRLTSAAYAFYRSFPAAVITLRHLLRFGARGCARDLLMVTALGVFGGLLTMALPIATGILVNQVIPSARPGQIEQWVLLLGVCSVTGVLLQITRSLVLVRIEMRMAMALQTAMWDRLLRLPLTFFRNYSAGALAVRAMSIDSIRNALSGPTLRAMITGLLSLFNFALLFYYSVTLALYATGLIIVSVCVTAMVGYRQFHYQRELSRLGARTSGVVLQLLTGVGKLRVAGAESRAFAQWARLFTEQRSVITKVRSLGNLFGVFESVFMICANVVLFAAISRMTSGGDGVEPVMSSGDVLAFVSAFTICLGSMVGTAVTAIGVMSIVPMYEMARPILQATPEVAGGRQAPGQLLGDIAIDRVVFRYAPDGPAVLNDLSITIRRGEFVAFVGRSGCGKSTILRLLLGFETPQAGAVSYDGLDLQRADVEAVRRQIGVVLQSGKLMPGDIYTNIAGCASITVAEAWEAARMVGLDEDVKAMPMGLYTVIGDGANTLSGGQRQRLMIARAIVHRPRILLLDEATSALDNRTQAIVAKSVERLQATRVVIAHRLSTIVNADRILVVEGGRIVQDGPFQELLAQPGPFADLAKRQMM